MLYYIFTSEKASEPLCASHALTDARAWANRTLTDWIIRVDRRDRFTMLAYQSMPIIEKSSDAIGIEHNVTVNPWLHAAGSTTWRFPK